jgi:Domain of unknown function (DUF4338)
MAQRPLFEHLLQQYHYLSHRSWVGENLQFLVQDSRGQPVACVLFGAPAWQCADRDRAIGWDALTRARQLFLVTNNTRFLIPPWAQVRDLASHLLSRIARRLSSDWQAKYGHRVLSSLRLRPDQRPQNQYPPGCGADPSGGRGMRGGLAVAGADPPDLYRPLF